MHNGFRIRLSTVQHIPRRPQAAVTCKEEVKHIYIKSEWNSLGKSEVNFFTKDHPNSSCLRKGGKHYSFPSSADIASRESNFIMNFQCGIKYRALQKVNFHILWLELITFLLTFGLYLYMLMTYGPAYVDCSGFEYEAV